MTPDEVQQLAADTIKAALKARDDEEAARRAAKEAEDAKIAAAVTTALKEQAKEFAKLRRLPTVESTEPNGNGAPYVTRFGDTRRYDGLSVADMAFVCGTLDAARRDGRSQQGVSEAALKALAIKIAEDTGPMGEDARRDLKAANLDPAEVLNATKANELDYSTQAGFGDEWVGVEYSRRLWAAIRSGTFVTARLPTIEVPQGTESIIIPLEGADPTWYKVGQTTATNATTLRPDATIPTSKVATGQKTLTVAKMAARVIFSEELNEDSLIPWAAQLRMQLETSGAENLEATIIDGDTDASATTNINDIGGTPAATDLFLLFNGFRKSALITTAANARSAGGTLVDTDFMATVQLMGVDGLNAVDNTKVSFIVSNSVNWKAMTLASLKTRDVFTEATLENGRLKSIWGYPVDVSYFMHFQSAARKANVLGKVDRTTTTNNTTGSILAVRWDQWLLGFKRRMTMKVQDIPDSDASQIIAVARVGLAQRDTEAVAITYNVGV